MRETPVKAVDFINQMESGKPMVANPSKWREHTCGWFWGCIAIICFHTAYLSPKLSFLMIGYAMGLVGLAGSGTPVNGFRIGVLLGLSLYAPHLTFFWRIFGALAIALWLVLATWIGFFICLSRTAFQRWGRGRAIWVVPIFWLGMEYARSELYYLRFSWLNMGYAFAEKPHSFWLRLGVYGTGFMAMVLACGLTTLKGKRRFWAILGVILLAVAESVLPNHPIPIASGSNALPIAGVQLEFPGPTEVLIALRRVDREAPEAKVVVFSEYAFDGPIPDAVRRWCKKSGRYVIAGGKNRLPDSSYYNTAFVVDPKGEVVFQQAKSVPIQFFDDGLPAPNQELWDSPWGKIGICICYDLSYTRITDGLVRRGAQALIVPTSDVMEWGVYQHQLHAHVAPVRASEYGIPIFRLASSGVSQLIAADGVPLAQGSIPGEGEIIKGIMQLGSPGKVPFDRILSVASVTISLGCLVIFLLRRKPSS